MIFKDIVKEISSKILNPSSEKLKKTELKEELQIKFNRSLYLKDYLKTKAWTDYKRPQIVKELESGILRLMRDGLKMTEVELKSVLAYMKSYKDELDRLRYDIEFGEEAGQKLEKMK